MYVLDGLLPTLDYALGHTKRADESSTGLESSARANSPVMVIHPARSNHPPVSILGIVATLQQTLASRLDLILRIDRSSCMRSSLEYSLSMALSKVFWSSTLLATLLFPWGSSDAFFHARCYLLRV